MFMKPHRLVTRIKLANFVAGALCSVCAFGCSKPQSFTDTENRTFAAECKDDRCSYHLAAAAAPPSSASPAPAPAPSAGTAAALRATGHLLAVCDSANGNVADCRAITCKDSCPETETQKPTCERGLCVIPGTEITQDDVLLLCLAGTGMKRNARQAGRMALARSCGTPCQVPAACRQP
jgi:hypothetical protein